MDELSVTFAGRRIELRTDESLGIGRANTEPARSVGWGYRGRFLELSPSGRIHRLWAELTWRNGVWCVRSMGAANPVVVALSSGGTVELPAWTSEAKAAGAEPETLAIATPAFTIRLPVASDCFEVDCAWTGAGLSRQDLELTGNPTEELAQTVVDSISELEFRVLYVMSEEYREARSRGSGGRSPAPLSYARIRHRLGLATARQATAAVERLVRRFRESGLLPSHLAPEDQRARICEVAVTHRLIPALLDRYGEQAVSGF